MQGMELRAYLYTLAEEARFLSGGNVDLLHVPASSRTKYES